jgi:hypothetical protein
LWRIEFLSEDHHLQVDDLFLFFLYRSIHGWKRIVTNGRQLRNAARGANYAVVLKISSHHLLVLRELYLNLLHWLCAGLLVAINSTLVHYSLLDLSIASKSARTYWCFPSKLYKSW